MSLLQLVITISGLFMWLGGLLSKDWWWFAEGSTTVLGSLLFLIVDRLDEIKNKQP